MVTFCIMHIGNKKIILNIIPPPPPPQGEHSAILLSFIKLAFVTKIFVLSIFEWRFYTGFSVHDTKNIWATAWDFHQCGMCDQQMLRPACQYTHSDQSLC